MSERSAAVLRLFEPAADETPSSVRARARELSTKYLQGDEHLPLAAGDFAGPYEVIEVLGSGGQAVVYKARHRQIGRHVALKVPRRDVGNRLLREAELAAHLEHPSIARVEDIQLEGPVPFLVMELCERGSLDDLLEEHPNGLPFDRAREIATAVLEALAFAHERGVIHRDIKPANILFDKSGTLKVSDFGIGTLARADTLSVSVDASQRTLLAGTPLYVAPEQEDPSLRVGGRLDGRADLYSFGKVLFQMLTGASPRTMRPVSRIKRGLSPLWDDYLWKLVEDRPEKRYASAKEALAAMPGASDPVVRDETEEDSGYGGDGTPEPAEQGVRARIRATADAVTGVAWSILAILWVFGGTLSLAQFLCAGLGVQLVATLVKLWTTRPGRAVIRRRKTKTPAARSGWLRTVISVLLIVTCGSAGIAMFRCTDTLEIACGGVVAAASLVALVLNLARVSLTAVFGGGLAVAGVLLTEAFLVERIGNSHPEALPLSVGMAVLGVVLAILGLVVVKSEARTGSGLVVAEAGPLGERRIGGWTPAICKSQEPVPVSLALTLEAAGDYEVEWSYEHGASGLWVDGCSLVEDGAVKSIDAHRAWAGVGPREHVFRLKLDAVRPGARYELRSRIRSEGGTDSHGSVWIKHVGS
jgi:serine/threonine protein kinase